MGVFNRNNKQSTQDSGATIVPHGTHIVGGINTKGTIHIDGIFEGVITAASYVVVGKTGELYGKIEAKSLTVSGVVDGVIDCDNIHILSSGRVIGELKYEKLHIDPNGLFEGNGKIKNFTLTSRYSEVKESIKSGFLAKK